MENAIYLLFNGNCEEAMNFYKETLGGSIKDIMRYGESPEPGSEAQKDKVMHAVMDIMGMPVLFSDAPESNNVTIGDNFSISLTMKSDGDQTRIFDALSTGGRVTMPLQDVFWGSRFGMCTDKFGVNWMLSYGNSK